MISEAISLCREEIRDQTVPYRVSDTIMKEWFRKACFDAKKILGFPALDIIQYNFEPYDTADVTEISPAKFENFSNITVNQYLYLTSSLLQGVIETKSLDEDDRLAMVKITANCKGGTISDDVVFDISLDKPNTEEDGNSGTWLVADGLISAIENGVFSLIDTIVSKHFAIKITIGSGKAIKLVDLSIERFRLSVQFTDGDIDDIAKLMASYDYLNRASDAINAGNSKETIDFLFYEARRLKNEVLNINDGEAIKANTGGSVSHYISNKYAKKALEDKNEFISGFGDGSIVSVTSDGTIRRTSENL